MKTTSMAKLFLPVLLLAALASAASAETLPQSPHPFATPARTFSVMRFGADGRGEAKDTEAFQKALDAAGRAGGGQVLVPAGTYLVGSLMLRAHTTLRLTAGATVRGSDDPTDYPLTRGRWEGLEHTVRRALLSAQGADGIALVGAGTLQGGATVGEGRDPRGPVLFEPVGCHGVRIEGLTLRNAGVWTVHPTFCSDIIVSHVRFDTRGKNADGLDPDSCQRVRIEGCTFSTGDDCISLKSGKGLVGANAARPCEDVLVTGCTFGEGHGGVAMGSELSGGIRRVRVEHCTFGTSAGAPRNALLIKSTEGRGGFVEDVTAEDLTVSGTNVFVVNTLYHSNPDAQPVPGPAGITRIRNIRIHGVRATAKSLIDVTGFAQKPLDGLSVSDITGTCERAVVISNAVHVALGPIAVSGYSEKLLTLANVQGTGLGR